jgi:type VI secretion system secreted protein VgrG
VDVKLAIDGKTPDPKLGIVSAFVEEGINQVSFIDLLTVSDFEYKEEDLEEMVGKPATLTLAEPFDQSLQFSRFDGVIYEFHEQDPFQVTKNRFIYRLIIRPKVWKLSIGNNSRSFPNKTKIDVIKEVLEEYGLVKGNHFETHYFKESVYPTLSQILQCEISDWTFIRRLMDETGINFYFGATKDGDKEEMLHIVDANAFFPKGVTKKIPWNPSSQMAADRRIESFETRARAVPSTVEATAVFGDGLTRIFEAEESLAKGKGGAFRYYCAGGQEEQVAKQSAKVLSESFESLRVTYEGESNHFLIRAGERISIEGPSAAKCKDVLVTAVRHCVQQTADAAFGEEGALEYSNTFTAVRAAAEVRPSPFIHVIDACAGTSKGLSERSQNDNRDNGALPFGFDGDGNRRLQSTLDRLGAATVGFGVMLGTVIEDAKVSEGKEMTCKIENERFPDGLTIKVSAPWLVPGGGVTSLPRVGMQVYFMLVQGECGEHEGVMLAYRPSGDVPGLNPAKQTETAILKAGPKPELDKPGKPVVEKSSMSPSNRQRNALSGEGGVCEMAVIDGSDATMSLSANNTIALTAKANTNISSKNHMQMADVANEQFGELTLGVSGDCTESINGNHQFSLQGNQDMFVAGNIKRTVSGNVEETVSGNKNNTVSGNQDVTVSGNFTETISGNSTSTVGGDQKMDVGGKSETTAGADVKITSGAKCEITSGADTKISSGAKLDAEASADVSITGGGAVKITGTSKLELVCGGGSIAIDAAGNVTINGIKVDLTGSAPVSITGAMVKINA